MYNSSANENRNEDTYLPYVKHISKSLDFFPAGTNALILGLGGGSIANTLASKNFNVDVCELDKNIVEVAKKYFNLSPKVQVTVDDARHYIKICKKKYDVIIFDTFRGEDTPNHVFTTQSLQETKQLLIPNGLIIVNTMGYINGTIGKAMRSIYKTFLNSDFNVQVLATDKNEDNNNFLFYASTGAHNPDTNFIPASAIDTADAVLLKDEFPLLDVLNAQASKRWRILAIQGFANSYEKTLPVFK